MRISTKEKRIQILRTNVPLWDRWRRVFSGKLEGIDLTEANLSGANLCGANLEKADLSGADLNSANLVRTNLYEAVLSGADFSHANLGQSDLRNVDLQNTNLEGANLDFSGLHFSCDTLEARFDARLIIQILYHAAMPAQKHGVDDLGLLEVFNSPAFKSVVNRFHRVGECGAFGGVKLCKEEVNDESKYQREKS